MDFKDYYATLGVAKTASDAEIKKAYRRLARKHHPDLNPGDKKAEALFKDVNEANEVLGDPEKRRKYDELGSNWRQYDQPPPPHGAGAGGFGGFGGGSTGARTMTPEEMQEMFGGAGAEAGDSPFSDFFERFFGGTGGQFGGGGRGPSRAQRPRRGRDYEQSVDLSLEEAYTGATRRIAFRDEGHTRTIDVRIPAGVKDGARVRSTGEGEPSPGGTAGDLYLIVHLLPHARFERKGQDLHTKVPVPVTTAVLGGEVTVPTLSGSTLRLKVPELTQSGQVFRLRGHGMPTVGKADVRGDLYATADVQVPTQLSDDARAHFEALRELEKGSSS